MCFSFWASSDFSSNPFDYLSEKCILTVLWNDALGLSGNIRYDNFANRFTFSVLMNGMCEINVR